MSIIVSKTALLTLPTSANDTLLGRNTTDTITNKTQDTASNTFTITSGDLSATNINSVLNQALLTSSNVQHAILSLGTTSANAPLQFAAATTNRKIVLSETANNDHQYYGLGVNTNILRNQVDSTSSNFVYYAGTSSSASNEVFRIQGTGGYNSYNGKLIQYSASGTTNSITPQTAITIAVPTNKAITVETNCVGYVTVGTNINRSFIRRLTSRVTNVAGTVTTNGSIENLSNNDTNLSGVTVTHIANSTNVLVRFTGIASDTISYTVFTHVFYM